MDDRPRRRLLPLVMLLVVAFIPSFLLGPGRFVAAQEGTPPLSCEPAPRPPASPAPGASAVPPPAPPSAGEDATAMTVGYIPISIYAPLFVAADKGYYAAEGLDVTLEPLAGGNDLVALTASGQLEAAATGAGPGLWNAVAQGFPVAVVAPGHREGNPVATPLMISKEACASGRIGGVGDLAGKRVAVNARGATEFWLDRALGTAGLGLDDVDLETLAFPDAVLALEAGALDGAMIAEPFATQAEQQGRAVRLATDFPVQDVQPTAIVANADFLADNPDAVQGFVTAYLRACRDLAGSGFADPTNLAIIERYTSIPAELIGAAVPPIYSVDGAIDPVGLGVLQTFFRARDQLEYEEDLDPNAFIDRRFVEAALVELGQAPTPATGT